LNFKNQKELKFQKKLNFKRQKEPKSFFSTINSNNASIVAQTIVSCLKSAHARAAVREPPGHVIASCFHLVATFFSMIFMTLFFSQNNAKSSKKVPKILPKSVRNLTLARFSLIFCTPCF
jgi:predicted PurR-regulated permease PerM